MNIISCKEKTVLEMVASFEEVLFRGEAFTSADGRGVVGQLLRNEQCVAEVSCVLMGGLVDKHVRSTIPIDEVERYLSELMGKADQLLDEPEDAA